MSALSRVFPYPFLFFFLPFVVSWGLTALLIRLAPRLGLVDVPNERKVHTRPVPRGGGLAIFAALVVTPCLLPPARSPLLVTVLVVGGAVVLLGLVDDLRSLPWQLRLGVQALTVLLILWRWPEERSWLLCGLALLWIVGLVNAFNMLDNMDALSAGTAWVAAAVFSLAGTARWELSIDAREQAPYLALLGATLGFLWFNRPPARIFMGDAGSTFLGFYLGVLSLDGGFVEEAPRTWFVPLCVLAVPCYDCAAVVALRLWQGRSPFHADKQHISHRLVLLGLSPPAAVRVIHLLGLASGLGGLLLYFVPDRWAGLVGVQLGCVWLAVAAVEYFPHFRSQGSTKTHENTRKEEQEG